MEQEMIIHMKSQMVPSEQMVERLMVRLNEIQNEEVHSETMQNQLSDRRYYKAAVAAIFVLAMILFWFSPAGTALAEHIMEWMKPKNVTEQIEGLSEEAVVTPEFQTDVQTGDVPYVVYVDEEYFISEFVGNEQIIKGIYNEDAKMTITHQSDIGLAECLEKIIMEKEVSEYQTTDSLEITRDNKGIWYAEGMEWDDMVYTIYVIDDGKSGCYIASYENTVEAEEGFGTRFRNILKTFRLIEDIEE